jgi:hypothetical protein
VASFFPFTYSFYSFGQLFSNPASENTELRQFGECLAKRIHNPDTFKKEKNGL